MLLTPSRPAADLARLTWTIRRVTAVTLYAHESSQREGGRLQLDTFVVHQVMIHKIPKVRRADKESEQPELTEAPIALTPKLQTFFRERILSSLNKASFTAVYQPFDADGGGTPSVVPQLVVDYFASGQATLVEASRQMAEALYQHQGGSSSAGMLVVIDGRVGAGKSIGAVLAVLKLEDDEALLVEPDKTPDGKTTFAATLQPVTLPKDSKVFKAAIFPHAKSLSEIEPTVSDSQRDSTQHSEEVATFFLRFLGCALRDTADRATKEYLARAEAFVGKIGDESKQARYLDAILADVGSQSSVIDPKEFAKRHLDKEDRDDFLAEFKAEDGSVPQITKELSLVSNRINRITLEFPGKVRVTGPREAVHNLLEPVDGGWMINSPLEKGPRSG